MRRVAVADTIKEDPLQAIWVMRETDLEVIMLTEDKAQEVHMLKKIGNKVGRELSLE